MQFNVGSSPVQLAMALGLQTEVAETGSRVIWHGELENAGPASVFLLRSATAPDPETMAGGELARRGRRRVTEYSNGAPVEGPWWLWTTSADCTVIAERMSDLPS